MISKIVKWIIISIFLPFVILVGFFYNAYQEVKLDADKLINYHPNVSTKIVDRNGNLLAYIFKDRHRLYAKFDEIPSKVIEALIAIEDTNFFEHQGISFDAIIRAIIVDIKAGRFVEGGSTLTQQLVKNSLLDGKKKIIRKIKEAVLAVKVEDNLSKEDIIERYLNEIPYGNNYYGIKTASHGYFHKELNQLTLKESAILVGLPNAPSYYNPRKHYRRILNRANAILCRMKNLGWIDESQYEEAVNEIPTIHRTTLTQNVAPYVVDEVLRRFKNRFGDIRTGGYTIYTTIDLKLQNSAKKALKYGYDKASKRFKKGKDFSQLNGSLISVENKSGDILAFVGGVDYKDSAFNRVTMAERQPGSTFKPFIYQTALDMGYSTVSPILDVKRTFSYISNGVRRIWNPKNYERDYKGFMPLKEALIHSRNNATINLICDIGGDKGCPAGIKVITNRLKELKDVNMSKVPRDLSLGLGNLSLSPLKVAEIYTIFSNSGNLVKPRLVSKIVSRDNAILYENQQKPIKVTVPPQAFLMTSILKDVVERGTGRNAKVEGIELAGKTGTTNDYIDAWFSGYSPSITTVIWFGRDNNRPIGKGATGGVVAAPVFKKFYENLLKIDPQTPRKFIKPEGVFEKKFNGKKEFYTKYSPLPKKVVTDIMDINPPELHPIKTILDDYYKRSVENENFISSEDNESIKIEEDGTVIESEPDPNLDNSSSVNLQQNSSGHSVVESEPNPEDKNPNKNREEDSSVIESEPDPNMLYPNRVDEQEQESDLSNKNKNVDRDSTNQKTIDNNKTKIKNNQKMDINFDATMFIPMALRVEKEDNQIDNEDEDSESENNLRVNNKKRRKEKRRDEWEDDRDEDRDGDGVEIYRAEKSNSNSDKVILKSEFPTDDEYIDYGFIERDEDSFKPKIKTLSDEVESMDYENLMF